MKKVILLLVMTLMAFSQLAAQNRSINGQVLEYGTDEPIAGATVSVSGTTIGTNTDADGRFTINNVPTTAKRIEISFIGMIKQSVEIKPEIKVYMKPGVEALDEVIVVAYGTAKKGSYAGSASLVKSDQIKDLPTTTFENALNGKVAGLQLTNSSGQAGSAPAIRIRGIGSMNAGSEPLYVLDGVPVASGDAGQMKDNLYSSNNILSSLNPEDIESISVLKDAAAASLYGSRAANGVIIITTKRGSFGAPKVTLKAEVGFTPSWASDNYEAASVQENVNMLYTVFHDARTSAGKTDQEANTYALNQLNNRFNKHGYNFTTSGDSAYENVTIGEYDNSGRGGRYFDWDDAYFRTAVYQTYDLSVSGATNTTNYYTSLSYTKDEGRVKINNFSRVSGRLNLNQKVGRFIEIGTNASISRMKKSGYNDTSSTGSNMFMQTRNLLWGLYWPTDYKTGTPWTNRYGSYAYNLLYYDKEWSNMATTFKAMATETLTIHVLPELDLRTVYTYDYTNVSDKLYQSALHFNASTTNGRISEYRTTYNRMTSSTTANYNKSFGNNNIGALIGFEAVKNTTNFLRATGTNLPTSSLHTVATAGTQTANGYEWGNSMLSWFMKADYNWNERYFISASVRRDGSSRLSKKNRWGEFWSTGLAWNIKKEKFMRDIDLISYMRLRGSYGTNGTLPSSNYGYMSLINYTGSYNGNPGGVISSVANDDLTWETSYATNIGIDFGLFGQRLRGTIEYFNRDSKNLLQDVPISTVTGMSSVLRNIGRINNHGVEIEINGDIISTRDWTWNLGFNATTYSSKVKKLYDGKDILWTDPTGSDSRAQYIYREGESTLAFYGYEWAGVDPENGNNVWFVNDPDDPMKGDFIFKGRGASYSYSKTNQKIIGNAIPDLYGGINSSLRWKNLNLGLNFVYKIGGNLYDGAYKEVADDGYYWERIRSKNYYDNMWTPTNTGGSEPRLRGTDLTDARQYSSRHLHNADFLRLKTLSLSYNLPDKPLKKLSINDARIFFNGTNLFTVSDYKDADPEVNEYGTRGWETPAGKTFTFGIELKF